MLLLQVVVACTNACLGDGTGGGAYSDDSRVTCGVMVNTSAFLACHRSQIARSSLGWGLNSGAFVCDIF